MGHSVPLIDCVFHEPLDSYVQKESERKRKENKKEKKEKKKKNNFACSHCQHAHTDPALHRPLCHGNIAFRATSLQSVFTVCSPVCRTSGLSFEHVYWWEWYGCEKLIVKRHYSCKYTFFCCCFSSCFHHFIYLRKQPNRTILLQLLCRGVQDKDMSGRRKVCTMRERVDRMVCMYISHCPSRVPLLLFAYRGKLLGT